MRVLLIILLASLLGGCVASNLTKLREADAKLIEAMGKDPATVCATATDGPISVSVSRTNLVNGKVKCSASGLEVESTPPGQTMVPVQLQLMPAR
jgi:hypothetical protein